MINRLTPLPDFLVSRYKIWKSSSYINKEDHYKNLASLEGSLKCLRAPIKPFAVDTGSV